MTPTPTPTVLCNRLVNPSFDIFMSDLGPCPSGCTGSDCVGTATFNFYPQECIPGWQTTHVSGVIEIWASGYQSVPAYEGSHFAEINASSPDPQSLFQTFTAISGDSYQVQFAHRGRSGFLNTLRVGLSGSTSGLVFFPGEYTGSTSAWTLNTINFTATETDYNLVFSATSAQAGGNFLDAIDVVCPQEFVTPTPTPTPTSYLCGYQKCIDIGIAIYSGYNGTYTFAGTYNGYPYYSGGDEPGYLFYDTTKWCLSNSLSGQCIVFGNTPCLSTCPDLDPTVMSDGPCVTVVSPTPTLTPTITPTISVTPTEGVSPTPTITLTTTPTPSLSDVCGNVGADITTGNTINPTPTPTPTPTPSSGSKETVLGAVTYEIDNGIFDCGDVARLIGCDDSAEYLVSSPIIYSGGVLSTGSTINVTIGGEEVCVEYIEDIQGSSTHIISQFNSINIDCDNCSTPPPSPTPLVYNLFEECGGVPCVETNISFGEQTNPDDIISNWTRFSFFANNMYPGSNQKSGLQPDGTILSGSSLSYFYTGSSKYLGSYNLTMLEGEDVGPISLSQNYIDSGKFYYNTHLNKFVVWYNVAGTGGGWRWSTYNPTQNTGLQFGNPTATRFLTTSTNWSTTGLLSNQYTVSGGSNTVVLASTKINDAGGTPKSIKCSQNSGLLNGFYSTCGYEEYQHEVTLESTAPDNDTIGLVLAAIKDDNGIYGPSGQTHTITLIFNSGGGNGTSTVRFNQNNNTLAFTDGTDYDTVIWQGTSPFGDGNYNNKGSVRVKVIKTGTTFNIYATDTMGTKTQSNVSPGQTNPYSLLVSFDLTNSATWTDAPPYAVGDELERFTGGTKFGYLTASQKNTYFYDIVFSGSQKVNESTMYGLNIPNLSTNQVYTFDEVDGCWTYIGDVDEYGGTTTSLTVGNNYNSCIQCQRQSQTGEI